MAESYKYSGVIYKSPTASQVDFALTTSDGDNIDYLDGDHIHAYTSTDSGKTWTEVTKGSAATEWDFKPDDPKVVRFGTAPGTSKQVRLLRITPYKTKYTTFQEGSLLTSVQLNDGEDFSMLVDQEIFDETLKIRNGGQVSDQIITTAQQLAASPAWENEDTKIPSAGAAASRFDQVVGNGTSYPGTGNKGQRGKIRIDNTVTPQKMFWWDESLSTPAWVEIKTEGKKGDTGPQGPKGDKGDKGDPGKDGTGAGTVTSVKGGSGITSDGNTATPTLSVDYGEGLEASAAGDEGKAQVKLDGSTITRGTAGIKVTTPFDEPASNGKWVRQKTDDGTSWVAETTGGSGDVTDVEAGKGISVASPGGPKPKISVDVDSTLNFSEDSDTGQLKVAVPFDEPSSNGKFVRQKTDDGTSWVAETASSGVPDVTTQGRFVRQQNADGDKSWETFTEGFADVSTTGSFVRTRTAGGANSWTAAPGASPWTRTTGTPNVVSPATAADTVSVAGGPLITAQVRDSTQNLTANGAVTPNFATSNVIRLSGTGMTINAPSNPGVGQSGIFYIHGTATVSGWNAVYHFPGGTPLTSKTGYTIIPFYVFSATIIRMGAATEDIRR